MSEEIEIILGLLVVMAGLVAIARRIAIPYPILLVVAGLGIGFVPGLPRIELEPDLVFLLFLPPILQASAYATPVRDFKQNLRSISLLAIGLVLMTMVIVAVVAHTFIDGFGWPNAFVLGAIVAPPDAVAASSIARRLNLPRRLVTVLEGESMLNDATSLVAYRVALGVVAGGAFSVLDAGWNFVYASAGGVLVGVAACYVFSFVFKYLTQDLPVYIIMTFLSGFVTYLLGETLHVSSVLAVVTLGIMYTFPRFNTLTPELRVQTDAIWEVVIFLLNGLIFILIGLQLHGITERLQGESWQTLLWYAFLVCITVIVVRIVWVIPATYLPRLPQKIRERDPFPPVSHTIIVAWTGMRGVVSLASALALPITITVNNQQQPYPQRDLITFLTFSVILATLVLQGLSLPFLVKVLNVVDDGGADHEADKARLKAAKAGRQRLLEMAQNEDWIEDAMVQKLQKQYDSRIRRYSARYQGADENPDEQHFTNFSRLERELINVELETLINLRNDGVINDEVMRRVQRDFDFELLRLGNE